MSDRAWFLESQERGEEVARAVQGAAVAREIAEIARDIAALVDAGLITLEHDEDGQLRARPTETDPWPDAARAFHGSG